MEQKARVERSQNEHFELLGNSRNQEDDIIFQLKSHTSGSCYKLTFNKDKLICSCEDAMRANQRYLCKHICWVLLSILQVCNPDDVLQQLSPVVLMLDQNESKAASVGSSKLAPKTSPTIGTKKTYELVLEGWQTLSISIDESVEEEKSMFNNQFWSNRLTPNELEWYEIQDTYEEWVEAHKMGKEA